jgi:putative nucleotidyltransferase with HDIG domain
MKREQALELLFEYTKSDSLIKHAYSVEACMSWYAKYFNEDEELWSVTGLLHDFDYEMYPEPNENGHPYKGVEILKTMGVEGIVCDAIMGHALYSNVSRETNLAKFLFACDELSGLVYASVLVRPDKDINNLEVRSVLKKMKDKAFAKGVSRDDIRLGIEEIKIDLETHIGNVIEAMRQRKGVLFDV